MSSVGLPSLNRALRHSNSARMMRLSSYCALPGALRFETTSVRSECPFLHPELFRCPLGIVEPFPLLLNLLLDGLQPLLCRRDLPDTLGLDSCQGFKGEIKRENQSADWFTLFLLPGP